MDTSATLSDAKLKSKKEKKKKANKLRKILKERLNIDCLRMLTTTDNDKDNIDDGDIAAIQKQPPLKLEVTS